MAIRRRLMLSVLRATSSWDVTTVLPAVHGCAAAYNSPPLGQEFSVAVPYPAARVPKTMQGLTGVHVGNENVRCHVLLYGIERDTF